MSNESEPKKPIERREGNAATIDAPQEEFIADQSVPSQSATDRDHGHEVQRAKQSAADDEGAGTK